MKCLVIPLIVMLVVLTGFIVSRLTDPARSLDKMLEDFVLHSSESLPSMVSPSMVWEKLELADHRLIYTYTILNIDKNKLDINLFKQRTQNYIQNNICTDAMLANFLSRGVTFVHQYYEKNHLLLTKIDIKQADCGL